MKLLEALIQVRDEGLVIINKEGLKLREKDRHIEVCIPGGQVWVRGYCFNFQDQDEWEIYEEPKRVGYRISFHAYYKYGNDWNPITESYHPIVPGNNYKEVNNWMKALETFFELKSHPFISSASDEPRYTIFFHGNELLVKMATCYPHQDYNNFCYFEVNNHVFEVIDEIGKDRLIQMFRTFQGIYE